MEQQCLAWCAEGGWETAHGPELAPDSPAPERADYQQVLLLADLEADLQRINPHLRDDIKAKTRNNLAQEKKYANRFQEMLRKPATVD